MMALNGCDYYFEVTFSFLLSVFDITSLVTVSYNIMFTYDAWALWLYLSQSFLSHTRKVGHV